MTRYKDLHKICFCSDCCPNLRTVDILKLRDIKDFLHVYGDVGIERTMDVMETELWEYSYDQI